MMKINIPSTLSFICISLVTVYFAIFYWNWNFDDAYIVNRYVKNLRNGFGWVYNAGEAYNASTSVLHTLIVWGTSYLTNDILAASHLIDGISLWIIGLATYALLAPRSPLIRIITACWVIAVVSNNLAWGLEIYLFIAAILVFCLLEKYKKDNWFLLGLIVLIRPDGIFLVLLKSLVSVRQDVRKYIKHLPFFLLPIIPWFVFSWYHFGQLYPSTIAAKIQQGESGFWGYGLIYFDGLIRFIGNGLGTGYPLLSGVLVILSYFGIRTLILEKHPMLYFVAAVFAQQAVYSVLNIPEYHWYYITLNAVVVIAIGYGAITVLKSRSLSATSLSYIGIPFIIFMIIQLMSLKTPYIDGRDQKYKAAAEYVCSFEDIQTIAVMEVGGIGYYCDLKIIDIIGLVSPYGEFYTGKQNDKLFELSPDVVLLRYPVSKYEKAIYNDRRFEEAYASDKTFTDDQTPYGLTVYKKRKQHKAVH